ncbi:pyruvate formate-lyase-activating protein [Gottschalkiaceae bacterium SANA]|nr:pyruvate formate-lyase-activating protein [Gottschalkiaceae bacterium SANA]
MGRIHSIETMGLLDGPGVRTVFFLQGCPLRCSYCHNPDTQRIAGGDEMTSEEIVQTAKRYLPYYRHSGGGVTFSGGEPLLQGAFLLETLKLLKAEGIHTALDTSGFGQENYFDEILELVDLVLLDIKHFDRKEHQKLTGVKMKGRDPFLNRLVNFRGKVWIRHVMVPGLTDSKNAMDHLYRSIRFLAKKIEKIEILPYHKMGAEKYEALEMAVPLQDIPEMNHDLAMVYQDKLREKLIQDQKRIGLVPAV